MGDIIIMQYWKAIAGAIGLTVAQVILIVGVTPKGVHLIYIGLLLTAGNVVAAHYLHKFFQVRKYVTVKLDDQNFGPTLQIAHETLPFLRRGLNEETAQKTAEIILKISDVAAVAITDREKVLAYVGAGCARHQPGRVILTHATKQVIETGELKIVENKENLRCSVKDCDCPLEAAVIAPLKCQGEVMGCVKLYQTKHGHIPQQVIKLAVGIAQLLAVQMELAEVDRQAQLVTNAELQALHAQINPHFLFNTLNTIIMFSRTNPETSRRLLIRLANFFRHALKKHGHFNTVKEELEYINTYLILEKARFREKLRILRSIDPEVLNYQVPVLAIQPLVENAVKHGITPKMGGGTVTICAYKSEGELHFIIKDDGVGIPEDKFEKVLIPGYGSGNGVGLSNVHERLKSLFGEDYGLRIQSQVGEGTTITVRVPLMAGPIEGGEDGEVESADS